MHSNSGKIEVVTSNRSRRRWTAVEKRQIVDETYQAGVSVSYIARKHGIPPSQLFFWRRHLEAGALAGIDSEEQVVPLSKVKELEKHIKKLERILGKKTMQIEILKEAITIGREKKLISRQPLYGVEDFE